MLPTAKEKAAVLAQDERDMGELRDAGYLDYMPFDPCAGAPLRYVPQGDDYLLYSVGPDGRDDGGQESASEDSDWVFTSPRPDPRREPWLEDVEE